MTTRARILLDVDGVLNAVPPLEDNELTRAHGYPISYDPEVVRFFNELPDDVEVLWLTTWCDFANTELAPAIGIKERRVIGTAERNEDTGRTWWKLVAVRRLHEVDPLPTVWIDDDLAYEPEAHDWLDEQVVPVLPIAPRTSEGLTPTHRDEVRAFLKLPTDETRDAFKRLRERFNENKETMMEGTMLHDLHLVLDELERHL